MVRSSLYTIIGFTIAIVVVVAGFFLLSIEQIAIHLWAAAFLILSLLISMGLLVGIAQRKPSSKDAVFYSAGIGATVWLYQIAVIISVALVGAFNKKVGNFVFAEISIMATFAIIALAVNFFARRTHVTNAKILERQGNGEYNTPKRGEF
ncbi:MAG: hypothetical protein ABT01_05105 [Clostridium sp. SCN 57-10]|nr:MAG: hypothetical protein ABT01_05105 [Clostridium sp. SCN 57-10]